MQFARVDGVTLHFDTRAVAAERPAVVFINSLGTDLRIWDDVRAALPSQYGTLAYDTRGHGLSDFAPTPGGIDDHVADLVGLMDHLGIATAVICGVSVGGLIAQGLCRAHPGRVSALLLSNTALKIGDAEGWNSRIAAIESDGIAALADGILQRWFSSDFLRAAGPSLGGLRNMLLRQPAAGYAATCAAIRDADFTAAAAAVSVPTLCVAGDADLATPPAVVEALAAAVPGAAYRLIEGAGHLPMLERPAVFAAILTEFLASIPAERSR